MTTRDHVAASDSSRRGRLFDDRSPHLDRFGLLLSIVVVTIVVLSLVDLQSATATLASRWLGVLVMAVVGAALLLSVRASGLARRWRRLADALVTMTVGGFALAALLAPVRPDAPITDISAPYVVVILAAIAPAVIVRRLLHHRDVTLATLLGAVAAYLLLPVAFFFAYLTVDHLQVTPFFGTPQPTTSFMYFSLSSVSTVGYGDLTAATDLGRLLATSEALLGQVYLVTLVALLVGLYAQHWSRRRSAPSDPSPPS